MWQSPYLYEQLQIHCSTVAQAQYVVPWSMAQYMPTWTWSYYVHIHSVTAYRDIFVRAHMSILTYVFVGSVNAFKLCRFGLGEFLLLPPFPVYKSYAYP
jgi:hypothetical protein